MTGAQGNNSIEPLTSIVDREGDWREAERQTDAQSRADEERYHGRRHSRGCDGDIGLHVAQVVRAVGRRDDHQQVDVLGIRRGIVRHVLQRHHRLSSRGIRSERRILPA